MDIHEFHVWQLSDTKLIASVHVVVLNQVDFMTVAASIKALLHTYGIHSATIQPEFVPSDYAIAKSPSFPIVDDQDDDRTSIVMETSALESACLLRCSDVCG
jgi:zinc transporter 1